MPAGQRRHDAVWLPRSEKLIDEDPQGEGRWSVDADLWKAVGASFRPVH
jgi:hypothetical protein